MKKFLIASLLLGTSLSMYARDILVKIETTCGKTIYRYMPEDTPDEDLITVAQADNILNCGESAEFEIVE